MLMAALSLAVADDRLTKFMGVFTYIAHFFSTLPNANLVG